MSSSKNSGRPEVGTLTDKIVGLMKAGVPTDVLGVILSEEPANRFQILTSDGVVVYKHALELYVADRYPTVNPEAEATEVAWTQTVQAKSERVIISPDKVTFQWRCGDGKLSDPVPVTEQNVQKACVDIARAEMLKYLLNFEEEVERMVEKIMESAVLQVLGFERDTWRDGINGLKLKSEGLLPTMLKDRLKVKFSQYLDQHVSIDDLLAEMDPLIESLTKKTLIDMINRDTSYQLDSLARKRVTEKMHKIVDGQMSALLNQEDHK